MSKTPSRATGKHLPTLAAGFWVALTLSPGAAPLRCYVGQIQAIDERGVRLTLIDWVVTAAHGYDLFVPWDTIESALVATTQHDLAAFAVEAGEWQTAMNKPKA